MTTRMTGADRNYRFSAKNHWRRTIWNQALARSTANGLWLYLPGHEDLDRAIATSKGVAADDLVAVDKSTSNAHNVKRSGGLAIDAPVLDVLAAWPRQHPVAGVVLDFCNGFELAHMRLGLALCREPFRSAAVVINLQRGRDQSTSDFRAAHADEVPLLFRDARVRVLSDRARSPKNRAALYLIALLRSLQMASTPGCLALAQAGEIIRVLDLLNNEQNRSLCAALLNRWRPAFCSYRSAAGIVFDSVIFSTFWISEGVDNSLIHTPEIRRRIIALLAVRTRRRGAA